MNLFDRNNQDKKTDDYIMDFEFEFYIHKYFFNAKIKLSESRYDEYLAMFLGLMALVERLISKDLLDNSIDFILSNNPTKINPDDYLFDFVAKVEFAYTKKEYLQVSSLGSSMTNIEIPTTQTRKKINEKILSKTNVCMYKDKDGYSTSLSPEKHPLNFILLPLVLARLFYYIINSLNEENKNQFCYSVNEYYSITHDSNN